jgi:hypothetical protein
MYINNPLEIDWERNELIDSVSSHDKVYSIFGSYCEKGICYDLEATGIYSCGELIEVEDIEVIDVMNIYEVE